MDDWEKAYEEDRRRLALGQDIVIENRRGNATVNTFAEKTCANAAATSFSVPYVPPTVNTSAPFQSSVATGTGTVFSRAENAARDAAADCGAGRQVPEMYAQYNDDLSPHKDWVVDSDVNHKAPQEELVHDVQFNLDCLPSGWNLSFLFGSKIGRRLFFAETIKTIFKGLFSSKETLVGCFVTPNCVYIGDVKTGALVHGVDIQSLYEVHVFDGLAVGMRTLDGFKLYLQTQQHTERLVDILRRITSYWRVNVAIMSTTADQAEIFRKGMRLVRKKSHKWELVEDPRTGLRVVNIPEEFRKSFASIASKILHWFGPLKQMSTDWKGSKTKRPRCAWVTPTCFFLAKTGGPGSGGCDITACVAIEYMTEIYVGPAGELGVAAAAGPPQPPLFVVFDSGEERNKVLVIFQECYNYRHGGGHIKVTPLDSIEAKKQHEKRSSDACPHLFCMRPQKELYEFLRGPISK